MNDNQRVELERKLADCLDEQYDTQNEIVTKSQIFQESNWKSLTARAELDDSIKYYKKIMKEWNKLPKPQLAYVDKHRPIPNTNVMVSMLHCKKCIDEFKAGKHPNKTPRDISHYEVGWTTFGFQAWCIRHECNVLHVDFLGRQLPANLTRPEGVDPEQ